MFEVSQELIDRQLENEKGMVEAGIERYQKALDDAKKEQEYGGSMPGAWVIEQCFPELTKKFDSEIKAALEKNVGRQGSAMKYIQFLEAKTLAFLTLRTIMDCVSQEKTQKTAVAQRIGNAVQEELEHKTMKADREKTRAYKYWMQRAKEASYPITKTRCLDKLKSLYDPEIFMKITTKDKVDIGVLCVEFAKSVTGLITEVLLREGKHPTYFLILSDFFLEQVEEFNSRVESLWPINDPMSEVFVDAIYLKQQEAEILAMPDFPRAMRSKQLGKIQAELATKTQQYQALQAQTNQLQTGGTSQ